MLGRQMGAGPTERETEKKYQPKTNAGKRNRWSNGEEKNHPIQT